MNATFPALLLFALAVSGGHAADGCGQTSGQGIDCIDCNGSASLRETLAPLAKSEGLTPLLYVIKHHPDRPDLARDLLEAGASPDDAAPPSALFMAAEQGAEDIVALLLHAGADPRTGEGGYLPLVAAVKGVKEEDKEAASAQRLHLIRLLVAGGADPNAWDGKGNTPLALAVALNDAPAARLLLALGAKPLKANERNTEIVFRAIERNNREQVALCLEAGLPLGCRNQHGQSMLYAAAQAGSREIVDCLLQAGLSIHTINADGQTAIFAAARRADSDFIRHMLSLGAEPNYACGTPANCPNVLFCPLQNNCPEERQLAALQTLLATSARVYINKQMRGSNEGDSLLMRAAAQDKPAIVQLLIDKGANLHAKDLNGRTALLKAADNGAAASMDVLLKAGARADETDNDGDSALDLAAMLQNPEKAAASMRLLMEHGVEPTEKTLFRAVQSGSAEAATLLLEKGFSPDTSNAESGNTLLHMASPACAKVLLAAGADPNRANAIGHTPLHFAARSAGARGGVERVRLLLAAGADANARNGMGDTPLMEAAFHGDDAPQAWEILCAAGADPFVVDNAGRNAIMRALSGGIFGNGKASAARCAFIRAMLQAGLDANAKDLQGRSALDYARRCKAEDAVELLLQAGAK